MTEHLRESRADLEERFLLMGQIITRARDLTALHGDSSCPACIALAEAIPMPTTVLAVEQEPREDLEEAVVSINDRLETVALGPECPGCDAYTFVRGLLVRATEKLEDE